MRDCYRVGWERNPVIPSHWVNKYHSGNQKYFPNNVKQKIFHYKTKKKMIALNCQCLKRKDFSTEDSGVHKRLSCPTLFVLLAEDYKMFYNKQLVTAVF